MEHPPPKGVLSSGVSDNFHNGKEATRFKEGSVALKNAKTCNCPAQVKDVTPMLGKQLPSGAFWA